MPAFSWDASIAAMVLSNVEKLTVSPRLDKHRAIFSAEVGKND